MTVIDAAGAVFFHAELRVGRATMLDRERSFAYTAAKNTIGRLTCE
jgi:hypothetical protein